MFASHLASHPDFQILNRFEAVRLRMLLHKQYRITQLVTKLDKLDKEAYEDDRALELKSFRMDGNENREEVFKKLDLAFKDHGE